MSSKAEKVHQLAEEIGKKLADAEQAGADGKVDESMKLMEEVRMSYIFTFNFFTYVHTSCGSALLGGGNPQEKDPG